MELARESELKAAVRSQPSDLALVHQIQYLLLECGKVDFSIKSIINVEHAPLHLRERLLLLAVSLAYRYMHAASLPRLLS